MEQRHLVLDARVIDRSDNARLSVMAAAKSAANPLFGEDRPWEMRFDNLYPNVLWDAEEERYKCWYSSFCVDYRSHGMTLEQRQSTLYDSPPDREMAVCYATSRDGIGWQKPDLGLVHYRGSRANNMLLRGPHGAGVLKDARETDPARRYKMFTSLGEQEQRIAGAGIDAQGCRGQRRERQVTEDIADPPGHQREWDNGPGQQHTYGIADLHQGVHALLQQHHDAREDECQRGTDEERKGQAAHEQQRRGCAYRQRIDAQQRREAEQRQREQQQIG